MRKLLPEVRGEVIIRCMKPFFSNAVRKSTMHQIVISLLHQYFFMV